MVKEIKYGGFSASPSDYECPEGDLAAVLNVVPEEGSLSPVRPPRKLFQLPDGNEVRFVHETAYIKNYIVSYTKEIYHQDPVTAFSWTTDGTDYHELPYYFKKSVEIHQVNAIGNTLLILTSEGMHYFLWKGYRDGTEQEGDEPKEYIHLGTHLPELSMSFGLQKHTSTYSMDAISIDKFVLNKFTDGTDRDSSFPGHFEHTRPSSAAGRGRNDIETNTGEGGLIFPTRGREGYDSSDTKNDEDIRALMQHINAGVEKLINQTYSEGLFIFPFFVRYAYRMFDGTSLVCHSAPILMTTASKCPINVGFNLRAYTGKQQSLSFSYMKAQTACFDLDYAALQDQISALQDWKDIIKSVDIFVSNPIYNYRQMTKDDDFIEYRETSHPGTLPEWETCSKDDNGVYQRSSFPCYKSTGGNSFFFILKNRLEDNIREDIESCNLFYLLQSIDISELKTDRTKLLNRIGFIGHINPDENETNINLTTLASREYMADDYDSHDTLLPQHSFVYNSRLQLANLRKRIFSGYSAASSFPYSQWTLTNYEVDVAVFYYVNIDNKTIVVRGDVGSFSNRSSFVYLYYPNINAYKAVVMQLSYNEDPGYKYYEVPLKPHPTLNGAFFFGGLDYHIEDEADTVSAPSVTSGSDNYISVRNKIYTSEVNNAYYFPYLGINTVGTGNVYALSTAAKALSQGQFGQFPLYAFSDEGVWALEVEKRQDASGRNEIGLYSARQPLTRDVCINPDSITQLDSSVLFATDRGIMLLSGSTSTCISDNLNYDQVFNIDTLPSSANIIGLAGLTQESFSYVAFREFLLGCRMLYDYVHQRIIVYSRHLDASGNPSSPYPYAYVYSLKTKTWGMIPSNIKDTVPSYPEALAMLFDGYLSDYSSDSTTATGADGSLTGIKGMIITRPLKLAAPDVLKTVSTVIQRGNFRRGHVRSVLWGSRDLFHWQLVWSSTTHVMSGFSGSPYKYFRVGVLLDLDPDESIYGCSIEYTPRLTNRLR